jgi:hypothetical protein
MDHEGFVSVSTIAQFNRMNQLLQQYFELLKVKHEFSVEWSVDEIVNLLHANEYLEVCDDKVRLKQDWKRWLVTFQETTPPTTPDMETAAPKQPETNANVQETIESNDVDTVVETTELVDKLKIHEEEWTEVKRRQKSNTSEATIEEQEEDDVFQFDESESWAKKPSIEVTEEEEFALESEFEDEEMDHIMLVTQHNFQSPKEQVVHQNLPPRKHATKPFIRSKETTDIADMINEGLIDSFRLIFV